jgi:hypothetical protein
MAIDRQFVSSLVQDVLAQGPIGPGNASYVQLQADQAAARAKISAADGKQVVSANAGESVSWQVADSLQDLYGAYTTALALLNGRSPVIRQTTSVFAP